jgi:hypothetical protein
VKTYEVKSVTLIARIPGEIRFTYEVSDKTEASTFLPSDVTALRACPEPMQAFIQMRDGRCYGARYETVQWLPGDFDSILNPSICPSCGEVFSSPQALATHQSFKHTRPIDRSQVPAITNTKPIKRQ